MEERLRGERRAIHREAVPETLHRRERRDLPHGHRQRPVARREREAIAGPQRQRGRHAIAHRGARAEPLAAARDIPAFGGGIVAAARRRAIHRREPQARLRHHLDRTHDVRQRLDRTPHRVPLRGREVEHREVRAARRNLPRQLARHRLGRDPRGEHQGHAAAERGDQQARPVGRPPQVRQPLPHRQRGRAPGAEQREHHGREPEHHGRAGQ